MPGHYYMPTLCYNAAMKISVYECFIIHIIISLISYLYTQNNEFILNALLECIRFLTVDTLYFNLPKMFY